MIPVLASLIPTLLDKGMELFDKKFETEGEKEKAIQEFKAKAVAQVQDAWEKEQIEITKRWEADAKSGSLLSKNIRPLFLVWVMFILTLMIGLDGNLGAFKINDGYIKLIESLAITAVVAYFGGRSFDKWNSRKS